LFLLRESQFSPDVCLFIGLKMVLKIRVIAFGIITIGTGFIHNRSGFYAVKSLLGIAESFVLPGNSLVPASLNPSTIWLILDIHPLQLYHHPGAVAAAHHLLLVLNNEPSFTDAANSASGSGSLFFLPVGLPFDSRFAP
jgi:hypothetical protein